MPPANESPRPLRWRGAAAHHPYAFKLLFMSLAVPLLAAAVPARAFYRNHTPPRSGHGAYAESPEHAPPPDMATGLGRDRKSTRLNSSHANISYAVFCLKKKQNSIYSNIPSTVL